MPDAAIVAPNLYKVLVENDRVRVLEYRGKPGDKAAMHSHPALVAYALRGGKVKFTSPSGDTEESQLEDGQAMFFEATDHATENVGTSEVHIVLVELK